MNSIGHWLTELALENAFLKYTDYANQRPKHSEAQSWQSIYIINDFELIFTQFKYNVP